MWLNYFQQFLNEDFPRFLAEKAWNYKDDLCVIGANDLACATGYKNWMQPILDHVSYLMRPDGSVINWQKGEHNLDKVSFGKSLYILGDLTGDPHCTAAVQQAFHMLDDYPRTESGNFWHKDIYPNQVWLDGFYMSMPFYARCLADTGEDRWNDIIDQFQSAHRLLWNENLGLYMHANDCSRTAEWADSVTGKSPIQRNGGQGHSSLMRLERRGKGRIFLSGLRPDQRSLFLSELTFHLPAKASEE